MPALAPLFSFHLPLLTFSSLPLHFFCPLLSHVVSFTHKLRRAVFFRPIIQFTSFVPFLSPPLHLYLSFSLFPSLYLSASLPFTHMDIPRGSSLPLNYPFPYSPSLKPPFSCPSFPSLHTLMALTALPPLSTPLHFPNTPRPVTLTRWCHDFILHSIIQSITFPAAPPSPPFMSLAQLSSRLSSLPPSFTVLSISVLSSQFLLHCPFSLPLYLAFLLFPCEFVFNFSLLHTRPAILGDFVLSPLITWLHLPTHLSVCCPVSPFLCCRPSDPCNYLILRCLLFFF